MTERAWVKSMRSLFNRYLNAELRQYGDFDIRLGKRLLYACQITSYSRDDQPTIRKAAYETDLMIIERLSSGDWAPCVVVEFKLGSITTHDALAYSAKAATHKHVHPYLRYGIIVGNYGDSCLPGRLLKHGDRFDFLAAWRALKPDATESKQLEKTLSSAVIDSRQYRLALENRSFHDESGCYFVDRVGSVHLR